MKKEMMKNARKKETVMVIDKLNFSVFLICEYKNIFLGLT